MIADIFKCPQCGVNVYLAEDETHCPLCGATKRRYMKKKRQGVDLAADFARGENAKYAHFKHLCDILSYQYGDRMGLYANDCWKYAWDATKTDMANAEKLNAFLDNPNRFLSKQKTYSPITLRTEIKRILNLALSQADMPLDEHEWDKHKGYRVSYSPRIRLYISDDLSSVKASMCNRVGIHYPIQNFVPVGGYSEAPITGVGYHVFECVYYSQFTTARSREKDIPKWTAEIADGITDELFPKKSAFDRIKKLFHKKKYKYAQI